MLALISMKLRLAFEVLIPLPLPSEDTDVLLYPFSL